MRRPQLISKLALWSASCALVLAQVDAVEPPVDFSDPQVTGLGRTIFAKKCSVGYCHGKGGRAGRGPRLRGRKFSRDYVFKVITEGVPSSSMAGWKDRLSDEQIWSTVAYIETLADLEPGATDSTAAEEFANLTFATEASAQTAPADSNTPAAIVGDPARGKELFYDLSDTLNCASCHKINSHKPAVGPDLAQIADKPAKDLLKDIVLPDALVPQSGQLFGLTTGDGEQLEVIRMGESTTRIKVYVVSTLPPVLRSIKKDQVLSLQPKHRSAMPQTYGQHYTLKQLLDIISFLKSTDLKTTTRISLQDLF